jgi:hypothetical protein
VNTEELFVTVVFLTSVLALLVVLGTWLLG